MTRPQQPGSAHLNALGLLDSGVSFVIHLGVEAVLLDRLRFTARARGMTVIELDMTRAADAISLSTYLARAFRFPHKVVGLDAAIDLISDLEWFGNDKGYLVVARGLPDSSPIAEMFASLLPNIVDRWRSQGVPFLGAIDGAGPRLVGAMRAANDELERASRLPWAQPGVGPVEFVLHGGSWRNWGCGLTTAHPRGPSGFGSWSSPERGWLAGINRDHR